MKLSLFICICISTVALVGISGSIFVSSGCAETEYQKVATPFPLREVGYTNTNLDIKTAKCIDSSLQVISSTIDLDRSEVERLLSDNLSSSPISQRYRAQRDRQHKLWKHLARIQTNDIVYVICAVARLQAQWENDLATIKVPERTITPEPILRTPEGLYCSVYTNHAKMKQVCAETSTINLTKYYLKQLRYAVENDALGIDSQYLWFMYKALDRNSRREVMAHVIPILGRSPHWEKWEQQ